MSLVSGAKLGPYEIVAPLGAGGMGEVYRARDTRLERTVAIKILPTQFSSDPVHRQRFEREAKTISSLNHPHICVLYDIGHQNGLDYLVMECVAGESLAKRLEKGPLPVAEVLKFGAQMAGALDKAHRSGVVHRDLKPGNIMLAPTGAKLLDFGLAKPAASPLSEATLTARQVSPVTEQGVIVGTFQYMSPEQVQGKEVDGRSDIFSLGAVLYEMLTGRKAFEGGSQISVASAILEKEPAPVSSIKPMTPPALDHTVRKCLAKVADERWQSASDLASELKWIAETSSAAGPIAAGPAPRVLRSRGGRVAVIGIGLGLSAALFLAGYLSRSVPEPQTIHASLPPPEGTAFSGAEVDPSLGISHDAHLLAFTAEEKGGVPRLWVRSLNTETAYSLAGTEHGFAPFWSPDNRWIGFFASGKLKKVEASGGPVEILCDAPVGRGGTWNADGLIVYSPNTAQPLFQVAATGKPCTPLTQLDASRQEVTHRWPQFLPDGKHYLYFIRGTASGVYVGVLGSNERHQVTSAAANALYAPPRHLLFVRGDTLMAQPFDVRRLQVTGEPAVLAQHITIMPSYNVARFTVSDTGSLVYSSGPTEPGRQLFRYDRNGKQLGTVGSPEYSSWLHLSPDGKRLALRLFTQPSGTFEIWIYDLARGVHTRASFSALTASAPVWSPDGKQIAYAHFAPEAGGDHMFLLNADGTGKEQPLEQPLIEGVANYPSSWSADGRLLLFDHQEKSGKTSVWALPLSGDRKAYAFVDTQFNTQMGKFSPDGRWVAYVSNDSGRDDVYVAPFPGPAGRVLVSTGGGTQPRWRQDGRELFFLSPEEKIMAAETMEVGGEFRIGVVRPLFAFNVVGPVPGYYYDVSPDGQTFITLQNLGHVSSIPLTIISNWPGELKKK